MARFEVRLSQARRVYYNAQVEASSEREAIMLAKGMVKEDDDLWCDEKRMKIRVEGVERHG